ncbi:MAG: thermonuclease family protein [Geminicoccaceae bacterium]
MEQIGQWLHTLWSLIEEGFLRLVELAITLARATTADHLEGAAIMASILLGPSLLMGLVGGFWQGLRIEWRQYQGQTRVIDGDTLEIRGERIRLFGVDTPELGQPWWDGDGREQDAGLSSKEALSELVEGKRLAVNVLREDQYRRSVAIVKVDGRDIARLLVSQGLAFASPGSSRYRRTEKSARRRRRGFWRGDVMMPWDFRKVA